MAYHVQVAEEAAETAEFLHEALGERWPTDDGTTFGVGAAMGLADVVTVLAKAVERAWHPDDQLAAAEALRVLHRLWLPEEE